MAPAQAAKADTVVEVKKVRSLTHARTHVQAAWAASAVSRS